MNCQICGRPESDCLRYQKGEYHFCGWCLQRITQYIDCSINHSVINIFWGAGRIAPADWYQIRDFLRKYDIKRVLEFGTGLSTELFVNEGIEVFSYDILEPHVDIYKQLWTCRKGVEYHLYEYKQVPDLTKLYEPFEFVFVDGPQERSEEVKMAMKMSNRFIYLHDPNLGEQDFFPNENWKSIVGNKFYEKI